MAKLVRFFFGDGEFNIKVSDYQSLPDRIRLPNGSLLMVESWCGIPPIPLTCYPIRNSGKEEAVLAKKIN